MFPFFLRKDSKELDEIIAGCYKKPVKGLTGKYVGKFSVHKYVVNSYQLTL